MTTTQPTEPMDTTPRDPHLPPPAVCDWLLEQAWPGVIPETRIDFQGGSPDGVAGSHLIGYWRARVEIGTDEGGRIFLPDTALDILRKDAAARSAGTLQSSQSSAICAEAIPVWRLVVVTALRAAAQEAERHERWHQASEAFFDLASAVEAL